LMAESCCRRSGGKFSLSAGVSAGADIILVGVVGCVWGGVWAAAKLETSSRRANEVAIDKDDGAIEERRGLVID